MSVEPVDHPITLSKDDCAVVFNSNGTLDVFIPAREEGETIPPQMLYAILVQEMLKDAFMLKVLTDRVVAAGILGASTVDTEGGAPNA